MSTSRGSRSRTKGRKSRSNSLSRNSSKKSSKSSSRKSKSRPSAHRSSRNLRVHLESLLVEACKVLQQYYPEMMPHRVRAWWTAHRLTARKHGNDGASVAKLMDEMRGLLEGIDIL